MGDDMSTSAAGFADPGEAVSAHARVIGDPDEGEVDEMALGDGGLTGYW